ncbi:MAG TPA: CHASE2 domain-containing protein, partial [Geminicoccaceae bacterium]
MTVALLWSLFLVLPHLRGEATILDRIEAPLADLRFLVTGPRPAPADIVVVAIDDETVGAAGAYPLPRPVMARLVRALLKTQPKAVALDVLFLDAGKTEVDADLAAALGSGPTVVAMAAAFPRSALESRASYGPFDNLPVAERLLKPVEPIAGSTRLGLVNISADHGGTPRHIPLLISADGTLHPALPLRVASLVAGGKFELARDQVQAGPIGTPVDLAAGLAIRFYGPQGSFRTVSAQAVLEGRAGDSLRDRIVIVGATAFGNGDTLPTPFDPVLPGVELLATGIAHLTTGDALVRTTNVRRADAAVTLGLPALLVLMMASRRVAIGLGLAALVLAGFCAAAIVLFTQGIWLAMA